MAKPEGEARFRKGSGLCFVLPIESPTHLIVLVSPNQLSFSLANQAGRRLIATLTPYPKKETHLSCDPGKKNGK